MEPHYGKPKSRDGLSWDYPIEDVFRYARQYAEEFHKKELDLYRTVSIDTMTPHKFWSEYIWTVYASGFNAKVLTKLYRDLSTGYGPWTINMSFPTLWSRVKKVIANKRKCDAVHTCRGLMQAHGWDTFRERFCSSVDSFQSLPFVGRVTKHHLARNLGYDTVKPDLHLTRIAEHYDLPDAFCLCAYLSALSEEREGVVDFILWSYAAAFGTIELA